MAKSKTNPNADETPFLDLLGSILCDEKNGLDAAMEREMDVATEIDAMLFFVKYHGKIALYTTRKLRLINK